MRIKLFILLVICSVHGYSQNFPFKGYVRYSTAVVVTPGTGAFTFTLDTSSVVSIGVFKRDSILVKTIMTATRMPAGTYTRYWNGTDDYNRPIVGNDSLYKIKVLSNNVQYTWDGTIGNTSDSMTGLSKMRGLYDCMKGLTFTGKWGYYCTGYGEGNPSVHKFDTATPNRKVLLYGPAQSIGEVNFVCSDANNVYWGCYDPFSANNSWVFGTRTSDDTEVAFSAGISFTPNHAKNFPYAISYLNAPNALISGIAVQQTANFLFVARAGINQLQVINKTTGALAQTLAFTNPKGLACDASNNLWMITGSTVTKYSVSSTGTLTAALLTLSGIVAPVAVQVSADGSLVAVLEGGSLQVVKFFNASTGAATATLGTAGGYFSDATVTNDKFYFNDLRGTKTTFIAFEKGGDFWVNDPGNYRVQHYAANRTYINRIMSLGSTYSTWVDRNNINRAFATYMEFDVDYTAPLTGTTGWSLTKNWGANVTSDYDNSIFFLRHQTTLSNGRTYGFLKQGNTNYLAELTTTGTLRFTGLPFSATSVLCQDGSRQEYDEGGGTFVAKRFALTGFDGSNNPVWASSFDTLASGVKLDNTPITYPAGQMYDSTNKVIFFNGHSMLTYVPPTYTTGYHLALMSRGVRDSYLARTEKSTHREYSGDYPAPGWFDVGNMVNDYAGGAANIVGRNIITSYHGEFWKASQANIFNHYYDNGLALGQFGITGPDTRSGYAYAKMAGNVLSPLLVKSVSGNLYMWHGDESVHSGMHRWTISGLNTINEQVFTIPFPSVYVAPAVTGLNLMAGLPFNSTLTDGTAGWTRNPTTDNTQWIVKTSTYTYDTTGYNDIYVKSDRSIPGTDIVERDLGVNNVVSNWRMTGNIKWDPSASYNTYPFYSYLELLDDAGKVLVNLQLTKTGAHPMFTSGMRFNTVDVFSNYQMHTPILDSVISTVRPFSIQVVGGVVTFQYSNYAPVVTGISDVTADWHKIKTLRFRYYNDGLPGLAYGRATVLKDAWFYKDIL